MEESICPEKEDLICLKTKETNCGTGDGGDEWFGVMVRNRRSQTVCLEMHGTNLF